jgi:hypothetical protein
METRSYLKNANPLLFYNIFDFSSSKPITPSFAIISNYYPVTKTNLTK